MCLETLSSPGPGGATLAREYPANLDTGRQPGHGTSRRRQPMRYRQPGCRRAHLLDTSLPCTVTLSNGEVRENAYSPAVLLCCGTLGAHQPRRADQVDLARYVPPGPRRRRPHVVDM